VEEEELHQLGLFALRVEEAVELEVATLLLEERVALALQEQFLSQEILVEQVLL
jgi:hypothetical protein